MSEDKAIHTLYDRLKNLLFVQLSMPVITQIIMTGADGLNSVGSTKN